jgi:hypothetical protein
MFYWIYIVEFTDKVLTSRHKQSFDDARMESQTLTPYCVDGVK